VNRTLLDSSSQKREALLTTRNFVKWSACPGGKRCTGTRADAALAPKQSGTEVQGLVLKVVSTSVVNKVVRPDSRQKLVEMATYMLWARASFGFRHDDS